MTSASRKPRPKWIWGFSIRLSRATGSISRWASTTDGLIAAKGFVVLDDDRHYFPPYDAIPVASLAALSRHHGLAEALGSLAGRIDAAGMRRLNYEVDGRKRDPGEVAKDFRATLELAGR
ncbi:MAG: hypothetical protein JJE39_03760 [Vicinamibacteria bacterium]|nr:hypothetical protein [Vicinamibacteria bacterium]